MTTMMILCCLGAFLSALCFCAATCLLVGHKRGFEKGYDLGRLEAKDKWADWWIQAEKGIDRERQKMWEGES